jgi:hypothetical protein
MKNTWAVTALLIWLVASVWAQRAVASCAASEQNKFICGTVNAEDLIRLPNVPWVIASGLKEAGEPGGHLFLINVQDKSVERFYPVAHDSYAQNKHLFAACPGKPDEAKFVVHGINLRSLGEGKYTLYVVNHGGREAVEIFEIDATGPKPTIAWIGCVITPPMAAPALAALGNAVAPLPNDAFVLTVRAVATPAPERSGDVRPLTESKVLMWSPVTGWQDVAGGNLPGANGVEASRDGKWLFVNAAEEHEVDRLALNTPIDRVAIKLDFSSLLR